MDTFQRILILFKASIDISNKPRHLEWRTIPKPQQAEPVFVRAPLDLLQFPIPMLQPRRDFRKHDVSVRLVWLNLLLIIPTPYFKIKPSYLCTTSGKWMSKPSSSGLLRESQPRQAYKVFGVSLNPQNKHIRIRWSDRASATSRRRPAV